MLYPERTNLYLICAQGRCLNLKLKGLNPDRDKDQNKCTLPWPRGRPKYLYVIISTLLYLISTHISSGSNIRYQVLRYEIRGAELGPGFYWDPWRPKPRSKLDISPNFGSYPIFSIRILRLLFGI